MILIFNYHIPHSHIFHNPWLPQKIIGGKFEHNLHKKGTVDHNSCPGFGFLTESSKKRFGHEYVDYFNRIYIFSIYKTYSMHLINNVYKINFPSFNRPK